jgi:UDP-N-acetyl-D-glucosamine dehydrogenase
LDCIKRIQSKEARIGVIGLGYVGLPLLIEFLKAGFHVTGFDIDEEKVRLLKEGRNYLKHVDITAVIQNKPRFSPTSDFSKIAEVDCIILCLPTPLDDHNEPDMSYVFNTAEVVARHIRKGHMVVLESTTYPGTTDGDLRRILETSGLRAGEDFHLAYSPEREDPNNMDFQRRAIPKIVSGHTTRCLEAAKSLYGEIVDTTVPVSSTRVAESAKLLENIYRAVNIALINEMKMLLDRMGIDVWEVIEAAKTKPFGFKPFYPGPGLGGHCIPIDPFYLTWKAQEYDFTTRFINLAGEINTNMPYYVVQKAREVLNRARKPLNGSRILVLGIAYKKDVDDQRESAAFRVIQLLREQGAEVFYHDPHVPHCRGHRHYPDIDMSSRELTAELVNASDLTLLTTDHTAFDYAFIEKHSHLILDTRNAFRANGINSKKVYRA